jgi:proline iminopeptidase
VLRDYFDPQRFRVVLYDQRGSGKSRSLSPLHANTTQHLVADLEKLRTHLGIPRWLVVGGSWGSALAVVYAATYRAAVAGLVLRSAFLARARDVDWIYRSGANQFLPHAWASFVAPLTQAERANVAQASLARLEDESDTVRADMALRCARWAISIAYIDAAQRAQRIRAVDTALPPIDAMRLKFHYFSQGCFLDDGVLAHARRIDGVPCTIVHGRHDLVSPPACAYELARLVRSARLRLIEEAGHAADDPRIATAMRAAIQEYRC